MEDYKLFICLKIFRVTVIPMWNWRTGYCCLLPFGVALNFLSIVLIERTELNFPGFLCICEFVKWKNQKVLSVLNGVYHRILIVRWSAELACPWHFTINLWKNEKDEWLLFTWWKCCRVLQDFGQHKMRRTILFQYIWLCRCQNKKWRNRHVTCWKRWWFQQHFCRYACVQNWHFQGTQQVHDVWIIFCH